MKRTWRAAPLLSVLALAVATWPGLAAAQGTQAQRTVEAPPPPPPEPTLATPPRLKELVPADVPPGTNIEPEGANP